MLCDEKKSQELRSKISLFTPVLPKIGKKPIWHLCPEFRLADVPVPHVIAFPNVLPLYFFKDTEYVLSETQYS